LRTTAARFFRRIVGPFPQIWRENEYTREVMWAKRSPIESLDPRLPNKRAALPAPEALSGCHVSDAQAKLAVAAQPSAVRAACSRPHCAINGRQVAPGAAGSNAMSRAFVGWTASSVYGQLATIRIAPASHCQ
jgi:hypothetical protein